MKNSIFTDFATGCAKLRVSSLFSFYLSLNYPDFAACEHLVISGHAIWDTNNMLEYLLEHGWRQQLSIRVYNSSFILAQQLLKLIEEVCICSYLRIHVVTGICT